MMRTGLFALIGTAVLSSACSGARPSTQIEKAPAGTAGSCERVRPGVGPVRVGAARQGNAVALARLGGKTLAYVADEDDDVLRTMDIDSQVEKSVTRLEGSPAQVLVLGDGRVAVTLRDKNKVQILEPSGSPQDPLETRCTVPIATEPFGLAATPDDRALIVTSAWARRLSVFDAASMHLRFAVDVAREPRAGVVDDAGERAFVAHVVGARMSVVDLLSEKHDVREIDLRARKVRETSAQAKAREGCQGFALAKSVSAKDDPQPNTAPADREEPLTIVDKPIPHKPNPQKPKAPEPVAAPPGRIFAPMVSVDPGVSTAPSGGYGSPREDTLAVEEPMVGVIDAAAERSMTGSMLDLGMRRERGCLLPRAAAVNEKTGMLFVTCLGDDALVELDTRAVDPMRVPRRSFPVPAGPTGVALDADGRRAVVWSQFTQNLSIIDLEGSGAEASLVVVAAAAQAKSHMTPELARGRILFHKTGDVRISGDGRACASCHPDGREDALTWSTPEGPRQTIMLAGRIETTAPFGWSGRNRTVGGHVTETFQRLGGRGVENQPGTFDDFDALIHYASTMRGPQIDREMLGDDQRARIRHGRELFFSATQGCARCHIGGPGTDKDAHNVKSARAADRNPEFDTPSLRFVAGTAPYFHDGRYATLDELLVGSDGKMGHTMELSRRDVDALKAYLESL